MTCHSWNINLSQTAIFNLFLIYVRADTIFTSILARKQGLLKQGYTCLKQGIEPFPAASSLPLCFFFLWCVLENHDWTHVCAGELREWHLQKSFCTFAASKLISVVWSVVSLCCFLYCQVSAFTVNVCFQQQRSHVKVLQITTRHILIL